MPGGSAQVAGLCDEKQVGDRVGRSGEARRRKPGLWLRVQTTGVEEWQSVGRHRPKRSTPRRIATGLSCFQALRQSSAGTPIDNQPRMDPRTAIM